MAGDRSRPTSGEPRVKGTAILGIAGSTRELLGPETYERVLANLPEPAGSALRQRTILPGAWVPLTWHVNLHEAILSAARSGPAICRRIAKHTTASQLRGIYRVFARVAGPEMVFPKAAVILQTFYSHADVTVHELRKGFCRTEIHGCVGFTVPIWENICGACEAILEGSGATAVRLRISAGGRAGDEAMTVEAHWL